MTKMFGNLSTEGLEETGDRLGGGGTLPTDFYTGVIKLAYAGKSQSSNAQSLNVHIDIDGREYRESFWVTNRNGENFYADKNDPKKKHPLPGFVMADDICLLTTGYGLAEQETEEKVVNLYSFEQSKEVPQNVNAFTALHGQAISVGLIEQIVDKNQKVGNEYVPTGETRNENVADKFFHAESGRTVTEVKEGKTEAIFRDKWIEKNRGAEPRNKAKGAQGAPGKPGGNNGAPGKPAPQANAAPKSNLFGG